MSLTRRHLLKTATVASVVSASGSWGAEPTAAAEWLLLVYMNGKNNLVGAVLDDFVEMAKIGSTPGVSVVVQMGRPGENNPPRFGGWSGVKRFKVTKGMVPEATSALMHVGDADAKSGDMGASATLDDFIRWGTQQFPAKRKMLVIWNHGQGWRFQAHPSKLRFNAASRALNKEEKLIVADAPVVGLYRSVSSDDDHRSILYNKQVQAVLEKYASEHSRFDVVGYDACLMAMLETAYSLRRSAEFMVGSQELEPGAGWDYELILKKLVVQPTMSPEQLASLVVDSYRERYGDFNMTTQSAVRLNAIEKIAKGVSALSQALRADAKRCFPLVRNVRDTLKAFADYEGLGYSVDCETLFTRLTAAGLPESIKAQATQVASDTRNAVIANYASKDAEIYSPRGLALYFPRTTSDFERDPDRTGYLRTNKNYPVDFVTDTGWPLFLKDYLQLAV